MASCGREWTCRERRDLSARDYDPSVGRWTTKDGAGFGGGLNFYVYAAGDPVNFVDMTGFNTAQPLNQPNGLQVLSEAWFWAGGQLVLAGDNARAQGAYGRAGLDYSGAAVAGLAGAALILLPTVVDAVLMAEGVATGHDWHRNHRDHRCPCARRWWPARIAATAESA